MPFTFFNVKENSVKSLTLRSGDLKKATSYREKWCRYLISHQLTFSEISQVIAAKTVQTDNNSIELNEENT